MVQILTQAPRKYPTSFPSAVQGGRDSSQYYNMGVDVKKSLLSGI